MTASDASRILVTLASRSQPGTKDVNPLGERRGESAFRAGLAIKSTQVTRLPRIVIADLGLPAAAGLHLLLVTQSRPAVLTDGYEGGVVEVDVDWSMSCSERQYRAMSDRVMLPRQCEKGR